MPYFQRCLKKSARFTIVIIMLLAEVFVLIGCVTQTNKTNVTLIKDLPIKEEKGITEESLKCITCHEQKGVSHGWIADWEGSEHARKGVGCEACHINISQEQAVREAMELEYFDTDRSKCEDKRVLRQVIASYCGKCHIKQYNEFINSRHSISWKRVYDCSQYTELPKDVRLSRCVPCHNIQYKCDSCHTRHNFSTIEAKTPDACMTCHTGVDHPQYESFISSKHGTVYTASQTEILKESQTPRALRSPICVTCHMPKGSHDISLGLAYGPVGGGGSYVDRDGIRVDETELTKRREIMLSVCNSCHSRHFAKKTLASADDIHQKTEAVIDEARGIISGLEKEGLISPPLNGIANNQFPGHALMLGNPQIFSGKSRMYYLFFNLTNSVSITWKGAYHMNPNYTYLYGWTELQRNLDEMKEESGRIQEEAELRRKMKIRLR